MPTALDQRSGLYGPDGSWQSALRDKLIWGSRCQPANQPRDMGAGFHFTAGKRSTRVQHIFCVAKYSLRMPLHSGHVMDELAARVLSRLVTRSTVVLLGGYNLQPSYSLQVTSYKL